MSIQTNFPALKPSLLLDFSNTEALDSRVTFTRASTATYYGTQTAKAEENLLLQSQDFTTTWSVSGTNATVTANTTVAPDGTTTADTLTEDSATGIHACFQGFVASGVVTISVFAKLGSGARFLTIGVNRDATHTASATFDLSLGTNTQTQANGGIYASPSATITAVAQGFYRCTFTITTDTVAQVRIGLNDTGTPATNNRGLGVGYTGDGTSSLILWGAQLEQRSAVTAYTATTTQPITNYIPVLETAASGVARFDHNPTTFESLGLLIEEQRTNLLTYSEQFDNAAWTKGNATVTANTVVGPSGTVTGDKLVEDATSNTHTISQVITPVAATTYTFTTYIKAAERGFAFFGLNGGGAGAFFGSINLSSGAVSIATGSPVSLSAVGVGNGWYRCALTMTATTTAILASDVRVSTDGVWANRIYTGDGYSGIYIWGAQLEVGAFPTSYIPTVASQVTRVADAASMTGANFSSWYNQAEGTLYAEASAFALGSFRIASVSDGTSANRILLNAQFNGGERFTVVTNGASVGSVANGAYTANQVFKQIAAYKTDDFALSVNGAAATTDTSGVLPVVNQANIGAGNAGTSPLSGHIRKVAYYPLRVTNAQLQALTS
jgi:hypothetical protein